MGFVKFNVLLGIVSIAVLVYFFVLASRGSTNGFQVESGFRVSQNPVDIVDSVQWPVLQVKTPDSTENADSTKPRDFTSTDRRPVQAIQNTHFASQGQHDMTMLETPDSAPQGQRAMTMLETPDSASQGQHDMTMLETPDSASQGQHDMTMLETPDSASQGQRVVLTIDTSTSLHVTSSRYLSVTISGGQMRLGLVGFDFSSLRLKTMVAALAPAQIRFGGTHADFLHFVPEEGESYFDSLPEVSFNEKRKKNGELKEFWNFKLSAARWDNITRFCDETGLDIMWDFNLLFWKNGGWDPSHARTLLEYSASKGVKIPAFQLGNEPNWYLAKFNFVISGGKLAENFQRLRNLVSEFPLYKDSGLYGPDTSNLHKSQTGRTYLNNFLKNGGCDVVDEVSLHHYYIKGREARLGHFLDPDVMENLQSALDHAYTIIKRNCKLDKSIRLTETSSVSGGLRGVTNAFADGFLWLDKLGLAAKNRVTRVFRQTLFGKSNYALITHRQKPNPDYYLSVLYKRLVEGPVFRVNTLGMPPQLRAYSHCLRKGHFNYPDGALVVYFLNTADSPLHLSLAQYTDCPVELFMLTPGDGKGLKSRKVKLNGQLLKMEGPNLPNMEPKIHRGDIPVTPLSYGFIVIPDAEVPLCKQYHRSEEPKDRKFAK